MDTTGRYFVRCGIYFGHKHPVIVVVVGMQRLEHWLERFAEGTPAIIRL